MKISDVLAISGKPGLFKILASSPKNLVVESMIDGKRSSIPGSLRVSSLSDITMYTIEEDVPLREILKSMFDKNKGKPDLSHNSAPQEVKDFIDSVVTDLDHGRVYASDLRKLVQWYNLLISQKALPFEEEEEKEDDKKLTANNPASKKKPGAKKPVIKRSPSAKKAIATKSMKTTKK
ncbi:MAG TPA: hypothetical protein EYF95_10115 [Flavobacteriales bacterium]|nr:hypothetical protein [Flavobacteriales bacterium]